MKDERKRIELVNVESTDEGEIKDTIVVRARPGKIDRFIWSAEDQGIKEAQEDESQS